MLKPGPKKEELNQNQTRLNRIYTKDKREITVEINVYIAQTM